MNKSAYMPGMLSMPGMSNAQIMQQRQMQMAAGGMGGMNQMGGGMGGGMNQMGGMGGGMTYGGMGGMNTMGVGMGGGMGTYGGMNQMGGGMTYGGTGGMNYGGMGGGMSYGGMGGGMGSMSDANLATAIGYDQMPHIAAGRIVGNGTMGDLNEHRRAVASYYQMDRGYY